MAAKGVPLGPRKEAYVRNYGKFRTEVYSLPLHRVIVYAMDGYIAAEHIDAYIDDLLAVTSERRPLGMMKRNPAIIPAATLTQTSVKRMVDNVGQKILVGAGLELEVAVLETLDECLEWIGLLRAPAAQR
jgi:hypothetical protein